MSDQRWIKRGIQLPAVVSEAFTALTKCAGSGEVKLCGAAAIGLLVGMPEGVRADLTEFVFRSRRSPEELTPAALWTAFESSMRKHGHWPTSAPPATTPAKTDDDGESDDDGYYPRPIVRNYLKRTAV